MVAQSPKSVRLSAGKQGYSLHPLGWDRASGLNGPEVPDMYEKNNGKYREKHNAYMREYMRAKRSGDPSYGRYGKDEMRVKIREIKESTPCADCGQHYPYWVMDFDHLPGHEKVANIAQMVSQQTPCKLQAEIDKCEVVCANCHRTRTHSRLK